MVNSDRSHRLAAQWFLQFEPVIRQALGTRISRAADIDDLAQEVYLRLLRVPEPELVENPQGYLYRVALNVAAEWRQRSSQALEHSSDPLSSLAGGEDLERDAWNEQRDDLVRQSLMGLPQASRTALILHVRDGLTYKEVAAHMGVTRRAVKRYVADGYAALRRRLAVFGPAGAAEGSAEAPGARRSGRRHER